MYPFYEKAVKSGINTICIHKGLLPADYEKSWRTSGSTATVEDLPKAAKDWPKLNFVIYHGALRAFQESRTPVMAEFDKTGRIQWATDLAEIPGKHGVKNVYARSGTAFATCAVTNPRFRGGLHRHARARPRAGPRAVGHGLGVVRLAAVADRGHAAARDPDEMQKKHSFKALGTADGKVKNRVFSGNGLQALQHQHQDGARRHHPRTSSAIRLSTWRRRRAQQRPTATSPSDRLAVRPRPGRARRPGLLTVEERSMSRITP